MELLAVRKSIMLSFAYDLPTPQAAIKGCAGLFPGEKEKSSKLRQRKKNRLLSKPFIGIFIKKQMRFFYNLILYFIFATIFLKREK